MSDPLRQCELCREMFGATKLAQSLETRLGFLKDELHGTTVALQRANERIASAPALRDALRAMVDAYGRIPPEELDHQQTAALAAAREALGGAK